MRTKKTAAAQLRLEPERWPTKVTVIRDTGTPHTCPPHTIALDPNCARCQELKGVDL